MVLKNWEQKFGNYVKPSDLITTEKTKQSDHYNGIRVCTILIMSVKQYE